FKERYIAAAKNISAAYLVSALNILNDTEINFKAARNKRLHIELALIKLTYFLQALEFSSDSEGVSKKKLTESAKAVAFRNIPVIRVAEKAEKKVTVKTETQKEPEPKLIIEEPPVPKAKPEPVVTPSLKSSHLDKLRKQIAERSNGMKTQEQIPLNDEKLREAWQQYSNRLRDNKNPALQSFERATLHILSENSFEVETNNNLEQKFIEQEKRLVSEHLQKFFSNKLLHFSVKVTEKPVDFVPTEKTLSKKDQYLLMIEQYPLVKELKDRLKLELDY
ncbi:MAG: DNA polymerase III subunit gamma/tau, partial [Chitinophagaceae bacterium]|nr:DNA polymerase III subunit gamma/tau [Chitinophagaceae bacterium]